MGLAYFILFCMIAGLAALAVFLLQTAWKLWKRPQKKLLAIVLFFLAVLCIVPAFNLAVIIWKEPPWKFH